MFGETEMFDWSKTHTFVLQEQFDQGFDQIVNDVLDGKMFCYKCKKEQTPTGKEKVIDQKFDATMSYELNCGHWMI